MRKNNSLLGFEYLRAICCVAVVIWHTDALRIFAINDFFKQLLLFYYYNIGLLAVPIFLQISLYLFYEKRDKDPNYFNKKRLPRLLILYGFWVPIAIAGKVFLGEIELVKIGSSLTYLIWVLITGGDTLFYFLFSLLFLSFLADKKIAIKERLQLKEKTWIKTEYIFLILSSLLLIALSIAAIISQRTFFVAYNNPLNFLPYIFSSYLIWNRVQKTQGNEIGENIRAIAVAILAILFFAILEWRFFHHPEIFLTDELPQYARISLVLGSSLITYLFIFLKLKPISLIKFLSFCSLGIYCIHKFLPNFIGLVASKLTLLFDYNLTANIPMMSFLRFWSLLLGSIILTLVMKRIKFLKKVV
ncbi:acyltransferase [Lusitaniella coriacea LEGE 07157]|uniref:Acyltransferase n=1 Tax=Lusitaniella coriacea LEGE 07157 TaxID=945747 RepID=A0A8J7E063_9CYAN|nr:acyltransferase [Lusitaniella coriacea]MBE9116909.1 acyltransferase [Lusitaniella coriacea LEGE 07157]